MRCDLFRHAWLRVCNSFVASIYLSVHRSCSTRHEERVWMSSQWLISQELGMYVLHCWSAYNARARYQGMWVTYKNRYYMPVESRNDACALHIPIQEHNEALSQKWSFRRKKKRPTDGGSDNVVFMRYLETGPFFSTPNYRFLFAQTRCVKYFTVSNHTHERVHS